MSGRWWLAAGAAVVVAGVVGAVVLLGGDDGDEAPAATTSALPPPLSTPPDDPDGVALSDLLTSGRDATYHATYTTSTDVTIEVWRDGADRLRQDTRSGTGADQVATASFLVEGAGSLCTRAGEEDWVCSATDAAAADEEGIFGSVRSQLAGAEVTPRDEQIEGVDARCFSLAGTDLQGDLCVTPTGIPISIDVNGSRIELDQLDDDVPGAIFAPPADVAGA